jgi:hypothetical protein
MRNHLSRHIARPLGAAIAIGAIAAAPAGGQPPDSVDRNLDAAAQKRASRDIDLVTPDARDAADGRLPNDTPAPVIVRITRYEPESLDWGDVAIGAGAATGLTLLTTGAVLTIARRRNRVRLA